jgi:hypothetical protein
MIMKNPLFCPTEPPSMRQGVALFNAQSFCWLKRLKNPKKNL